jgi:hypothetical protein
VTVLEFLFVATWIDYMVVSYYCLWSFMCSNLVCCECSVDIGEYYTVTVAYGQFIPCICKFICKLENIGEW